MESVQRSLDPLMVAFETIKELVKRNIFRVASAFEERLPVELRLCYPPTFIVGPPRTGSTLTMQLVTWAIPTCYFSNLTNSSCQTLGFPLPYTTALIVRCLGLADGQPTYRSQRGIMDGRGRSAEGTDIWQSFFGTRRGAVAPEELSPNQIESIYRAVALTERVFGLPFVNKTIDLSLRVRALVRIFPRAIFIQMKRDPVDVAQSIYVVRLNKPKQGYFGPKPKECQSSQKKDLIQQVCEQVYYVEKSLAHARCVVGEERFLSVCYKDICHDPAAELTRIAAFMRTHSSPAKLTRAVPSSFCYSHGRKIARHQYSAMARRLADLYGKRHRGPRKVHEDCGLVSDAQVQSAGEEMHS